MNNMTESNLLISLLFSKVASFFSKKLFIESYLMGKSYSISGASSSSP